MDIAERLKAAAEKDEALPLNEVQALFIEAADEIEYLRSLLEPFDEIGLEGVPPQGRA
ncbi:hypothetical protein [Microvirga calopogonii]|uniref:hypothetical protein n=1 Tax=Microvirga calopogonii TaxID=2078013 RepID=UPI0013B36358|nr:hypothetical protein [Microvirga calopogonii]